MTTRLTRPLLYAIQASLRSALAGEIGEGDYQGMSPEAFERALRWTDEQLERRDRKVR